MSSRNLVRVVVGKADKRILLVPESRLVSWPDWGVPLGVWVTQGLFESIEEDNLAAGECPIAEGTRLLDAKVGDGIERPYLIPAIALRDL